MDGPLSWHLSLAFSHYQITLIAFNNFKNNQKSVWSNVFWYVKICISWKCIKCTLHGDNIQILKKLRQWAVPRMSSFFFWELQLIIESFFIVDSYMGWSSKLKSGIFHFQFRFDSVEVNFCLYFWLYFCLTKRIDYLTLKRHGSFQN